MKTEQRIFFLNGSFVPEKDAVVSVLDRGMLFGDGVYEISAVVNSRTIDNESHLKRLERSLAMVNIPSPYAFEKWVQLQDELIGLNHLDEGTVYIQVTRGVQQERSFLPSRNMSPTVIMLTQAKGVINNPGYGEGIAVVTEPEQRWARRDIKSNNLLAQVLARQAASERGAQEAWLVEDGFVTEGAASSAFIVSTKGELVTRQLSQAILPGVTRGTLLQFASDNNLELVQRPFTVAEAYAAREAFISSSNEIALAVVKIDDRIIGDGSPGPVTKALREAYVKAIVTRRPALGEPR